MNNAPAVSIYIITYLDSEERGEILKRTCEWALAQRYPNFEVVVSDNGGDYAAKDALASIQDARLKVCTNEENAGFTGNINRCLKHCSHDLIKPLCDDDLLHLDFLSATVPLVNDHTLVVVDVEKFMLETDPEGIEQTFRDLPLTETRNAGYGADIWNLSYANSCIPSAILFTRKLFHEIGEFDSNTILSDWDFFVETCLCKKVVHVKRTLCYLGVWDGSETEVALREEPFFFPRESLYTRFRILRCKDLSGKERAVLMFGLWKNFAWQSLRPFKYPFSRVYRAGYVEYFKKFFGFVWVDKSAFGRLSGD